MKKALAAGLLSIVLVLPGTTVQAGGYYRGHGGNYYNRHGDDALIAAGIVGGAILLGSLLTRPRYYAPPVYYRPAPAYVPTCYQDKVWRRRLDGRIQTGIRTRCY